MRCSWRKQARRVELLVTGAGATGCNCVRKAGKSAEQNKQCSKRAEETFRSKYNCVVGHRCVWWRKEECYARSRLLRKLRRARLAKSGDGSDLARPNTCSPAIGSAGKIRR